MRHEEFAEKAAERLENIADRLEEEGRPIGGEVLARAKEMRVAAFLVRDVSAAVTRAESGSGPAVARLQSRLGDRVRARRESGTDDGGGGKKANDGEQQAVTSGAP